MDDEVYQLRNLFRKKGFALRAVGGCVRDYLFHIQEKRAKDTYKPKDVDVVTNAPPEIVKEILNSREAEEIGIHCLGIGAAFGIYVAQVPRYMEDGTVKMVEYEIASYRNDSKESDGRRPDSVEYTDNPAEDAKRRDLTFNALYYDLPETPNEAGVITDYNNGQGFDDVENYTARPVGDPNERFTEDRLRVMRTIRFFCRYNPGGPEEIEKKDPKTAEALKRFARMDGVSNERISQEFLSGLKSSRNPAHYLKTLKHFGMIDRIFAGLRVNQRFDQLADQRNPRIVVAWVLKDNEPATVEQGLNLLKMTGSSKVPELHKLPDHVKFLLELLKFAPEHVYDMSRNRDKLRPDMKQGKVKPEDFQEYVTQHNGELMAWAILNGLDLNMISNFINFQRSVSGYDPRLAGVVRGPELNKAIKRLEQQNFEAMTNKKKIS
jgi:tRNA nucleotidyltransferase/poly(A) polymerase